MQQLKKIIIEHNLALDIFHYKVRAQIGAYAAVMGGVDAIVFTAGVGENASRN